jgi:hypothetical protein
MIEHTFGRRDRAPELTDSENLAPVRRRWVAPPVPRWIAAGTILIELLAQIVLAVVATAWVFIVVMDAMAVGSGYRPRQTVPALLWSWIRIGHGPLQVAAIRGS